MPTTNQPKPDATKTKTADTATAAGPTNLLSVFLSAANLKAPFIPIRGTDEVEVSQDRRFSRLLTPKAFIHVEEGNFRHSSGYDDNWRRNLVSALERALGGDFGGRDPATQTLLFDALPPFDAQNRLIVIAAILPPAEPDAEG